MLLLGRKRTPTLSHKNCVTPVRCVPHPTVILHADASNGLCAVVHDGGAVGRRESTE